MEVKAKASKKKTITIDKRDKSIKNCGTCINSKLKFTIFEDLKDSCTCNILKGKFSLTQNNKCLHYKYNDNWRKRIELAEIFGEDIIE